MSLRLDHLALDREGGRPDRLLRRLALHLAAAGEQGQGLRHRVPDRVRVRAHGRPSLPARRGCGPGRPRSRTHGSVGHRVRPKLLGPAPGLRNRPSAEHDRARRGGTRRGGRAAALRRRARRHLVGRAPRGRDRAGVVAYRTRCRHADHLVPPSRWGLVLRAGDLAGAIRRGRRSPLGCRDHACRLPRLRRDEAQPA